MKTTTTNTGLLLQYHSTINNIEIYTYAKYKRVYTQTMNGIELIAKCDNMDDAYQTIRNISINESYKIASNYGFDSIRSYIEHIFNIDSAGVNVLPLINEIENALHNSNFCVMYYIGQYMNKSTCNIFKHKYTLNENNNKCVL